MDNSNPPSSQPEGMPPLPATNPEPQQAPPGITKKPSWAAILSCFPGIGHVYNGLYLRGIVFFLLVAALITIAEDTNEGVFVFAVFFVWIFNMVDAVRQATLINYGYAQDLGLVDQPARPKPGQGWLLIGILLIVVGVYTSLEQFFDLELDFLLDLWPLSLVAVGFWLVWSWRREKVRSAGNRIGLEQDVANGAEA